MKKIHQRLSLAIGIGMIIVYFVLCWWNSRNIPWQFYNPKSIGPNNSFQPYDNISFGHELVIFNSQDNSTYALYQNSGKLAWQFSAHNYSPYPPTVSGNNVYLANFDGNVYGLDLTTGYKRWHFAIPDHISPDTPALASLDGTKVFIGTRGGMLYALNAKTGERIWEKQFAAPDNSKAFVEGTIHFGTIYVDEKYVYVFNAPEQTIVAVSQDDGHEHWRVNQTHFTFTPPLFTLGFVVVYQDNQLIAIHKETGKISKFARQSNETESWKMMPSSTKENFVVLLDGQRLSKINLETGQHQWFVDGVLVGWAETNDRKNNRGFGVHNNLLFAQRFDRLANRNTLLALDYTTGEAVWETALPTNILVSELPYENAIIFGEKTGSVIAVKRNTGELLWNAKLSGELLRLVQHKDGILAVAADSSSKNNFYLLAPEKQGEIIWKYTPDSVVSQNNIVFEKSAVLFLDEKRQLAEKIPITLLDPERQASRKMNFTAHPDLKVQDGDLEYELKEPWVWKFHKAFLRWRYALQHSTRFSQYDLQKNTADGIFELTLKHDEQLHSNPFTDVRIEAVFVNNESGEKTSITGYYFDNDTWKLVFRPSENAEYSWHLVARSVRGRKTWTGTNFLTADLFSRITVNQNTFTIDDRVFFPVGIQEAFLDRNYDGRAHDQVPLSDTASPVEDPDNYGYLPLAQHLALYKKEAGVNIFRYGVDNWAPSLYQSLDPKNIRWDVKGGQFGDTLLQELRNQEIHVIMTLFGFYPPFDSKEEFQNPAYHQALVTYLDYVIARYASKVDLWEIGNEARSDQQWYQFVISYIKKKDPYQRPISTSWEETSLKDTHYVSVHWYTKNTTDLSSLLDEVNFLRTQFDQSNQPVLISELGFKNVSWFPQSDQTVRVFAWQAAIENTGVIFWNQGKNGIYTDPNNANVYLGPNERYALHTLVSFLPSIELPLEKEAIIFSENATRVSLLKNKDILLAYFLKVDPTSPALTTLPLRDKREGVYEWLNPATGDILTQGSLTSSENSLVVPEFKTDVALKIIYTP